MAIIGVTHCPACGAVVNAHWPSCLACSCNLETSKPAPTSLQAQAPMESAKPQLGVQVRKAAIQPGVTVRYRIPVITSPTKYKWAWHQGAVEIIDENQHLVLVTPVDEEEPWRWVSLTYVQAAEF